MQNLHSRQVSKLSSVFGSVSGWVAAVVFTVISFTLGLIIGLPSAVFLRDSTRLVFHRIAHYWAASLIFLSPLWSLHVEGTEKLVPGRTYVFVINHQSIIDILVVLAAIPAHFKFIAKKELFKIPCLGWHMTLTHYIALDRGNKNSARDAVEKARGFLKQRVSVLFFPEGTRSLDGEIHKLKSGAFKLASDEKIEIVPCVLDGTGEALPKHSALLNMKTRFMLRILDPFPAPVNEPEAINEAREAVRDRMVAELKDIRDSMTRQGK